jgi:MarR family transcriptional regulator, organic hydroperoxide resistance regulator
MATTPVRTDPATEAWKAVLNFIAAERPPRFPAVAHAFDVSPMQLKMMQILAPGVALPMSALAEELHCDASNVTGIVDRLEERGLIERRPDPADRRVKLLAITEEGAEMRDRMLARLYEPPAAMNRLARSEQAALRELLEKALAERPD